MLTSVAAISTPASAGPAIVATFSSEPSIALAALSSSRSTKRGSSASSGGRSTAEAPAKITAAT